MRHPFAQSTTQPLAALLLCGVLLPLTCSAQDKPATQPEVVVTSPDSLVHLGSIDSFDTTEEGIKAGKLLLKSLETGDPAPALEAAAIYKELIPKENFGGEYSALQWFCDLLKASPQEKETMLKDPLAKEFYAFLGDNKYELLKEFLSRKYRLEKFGDENTFDAVRRESFLQDYVLFNNPRRESWERTTEMLEALKIAPGQTIADVGCGPGYFTFKFLDRVGEKGKIVAVDINETHVKYLDDYLQKRGIKNVSVAKSELDDIGVKEKVDMVWLCSLYHIMYVLASEKELDGFIGSIKRSLKPGGRFVIVDNALVKDKTLPYHGPFIAKELIIGQLAHYGFKLQETFQVIPQRYMLVFTDEHQPQSGPPSPQSTQSPNKKP